MAKMILASGSPRRAELLQTAGIEFTVRIGDVDEALLPGETPYEYVSRLATSKATAVAREMGPGVLVLGADTTVVIDDEIAGKPLDEADARRMLHRLSGQWHEVLTGVTLIHGHHLLVEVETTRVKFALLTAEEIDWYVASGEPMDKAGAYGIQGLASRFVERIEGSYSNVVGLPVSRVYEMLRQIDRVN
ncbi:MAG: septum formation inhibitor Maf [Acidobacteria bacterium]|jgi:septum formation protein|nr:septum formation inhibitor Maf [Acidobacteriota bacterium]